MKHNSTTTLFGRVSLYVLEANQVEMKKLGDGIIQLKIKGAGIVTHGEHGTIKTESEHIIKYIQQEVDPISSAFRNAFD